MAGWNLKMWGISFTFLSFFLVSFSAFASIDPAAEFLELRRISDRIDAAIEANQGLHPLYLNSLVPFKEYLYQVYEADLSRLVEQVRAIEIKTYQRIAEASRLQVVSDLESLCSVSRQGCAEIPLLGDNLEEWEFDRVLAKWGISSVQARFSLEGTGIPIQNSRTAQQNQGVDPNRDDSLTGPQGSQGKYLKAGFVRAFDRDETYLEAVRAEMVSVERTHRGMRGWQEASKEIHSSDFSEGKATESYWPTLSWIDPGDRNPGPIPLVSSNTIRILESKSGGPLRGGIVFGKVASGWALKWAGEGTQHPVFLSERFEVMSSEATQVPRYFIMAGIGSGTGLIQLISTQFPFSGSVRFPVLENKATYLDLSRPEMKQIVGRVQDREQDSDSVGFEPSVIRVAGQESPWTVADSQGNFRLNQVLKVSHYPIFLDIQRNGKSTLRYRALPEQFNSLVLYRMKEREIDSWRAQLNLLEPDPSVGGYQVNRESPLAVGYLRNLIARQGEIDLLPFLKLLPARGVAHPTAYVRSPGGLLEKDVYLSVHDSRVVAVQQPNSGFLMGIQGEGGATLYSEWAYASSGVVNVLGPE